MANEKLKSVTQGEPERCVNCHHAKGFHEFNDDGQASCCLARIRIVGIAGNECKCTGYAPAQPSPVVQTPAQFSNFCTEMDKAGVTLQFGLKAQGHMSTVERMRGEGKSWAEIGDQIGWVGSAVEQFYELETRPVVPVGPYTLESVAPQESVTGPHPTVASGTQEREIKDLVMCIRSLLATMAMNGLSQRQSFGRAIGFLEAKGYIKPEDILRTSTDHQQQR